MSGQPVRSGTALARRHKNGKLSDLSWNYRCLVLDGSFFYVGSSFIESATVLPSFVSTLTSSPVLIGMVTTVRNAGYLLPQVFIAGIAQGLSRKKPLLVVGGLINRLTVLALALTAGLVTPRHPGAALVVFFVALAMLALSDGVSGVPWTDILARSIPPDRRGRLLGTMQCAGGFGAFAAGFIIRELLARPVPGYPGNYAMVFGCGLVFLSCSLAATCLLREPPGQASPASLRAYLQGLPAAFRANPRFRQMMFARVLMSTYMLSLPFYIVHSRLELGFAPSVVGVFVSAQMTGNIIGGVLWGNLADRCGNRRLLQVMSVVQLTVPLYALASRWLVGTPLAPAGFFLHLLLFATLGACFGGMWMGFTNYLLDIVDDGTRPTYIGLMNTLSAPLGALPVAGGVLLRLTSYPALFLVTALLVAAGVASAWRLPEPRLQVVPPAGA